MGSPLRLLFVEDEPWIRTSVEKLLRSTEAGVEVTATGRGVDALAFARKLRPDVALVDIGLPDISGIDVIGELRRSVPTCVPVVFTVFDDAPTILSALRAGARGYILKSAPLERIVPMLREAQAGGLPLSPAVASLVVQQMLATSARGTGQEPLTDRETELLALLARGATYAQCAEAMSIGIGTVQGYVKNIYAKLDVSSKAEAAVAAARLGLV